MSRSRGCEHGDGVVGGGQVSQRLGEDDEPKSTCLRRTPRRDQTHASEAA
jgi:hypothetical protein